MPIHTDAMSPEVSLSTEFIDAPFGVVVRGVDWERPSAEVMRQLTVLMRSRLLLVFRGQPSPTKEQLDGFFSKFGRLVLETYDGTFHYQTFNEDEGEVVRRLSNQNFVANVAGGASELVWHCDQSHRPQLKVISALEAIEVEGVVVPTQFRDMYVAYETLPADLRMQLQHRQGVFFDPRMPSPDVQPRLADAMHLVFTPHPTSGRVALYVNDYTRRVVGFSLEASDEILVRVRAHIDANAPRFDHQWLPGDFVVWDNVGLQHRRDAMPPGQIRKLRQYEGVAE